MVWKGFYFVMSFKIKAATSRDDNPHFNRINELYNVFYRLLLPVLIKVTVAAQAKCECDVIIIENSSHIYRKA